MSRLTFEALGDSLTVGYQSSSAEDYLPRPTPYTGFLKDMTGRLLKDIGAVDVRVEFRNKGVVGELTEDILQRFKRDVIDIHSIVCRGRKVFIGSFLTQESGDKNRDLR